MPAKTAFWLLATMLTVGTRLCAQGFGVHIVPDKILKGQYTLTIFEDSSKRQTTSRLRHGTVEFEGSVRAAAYAELTHPLLPTPLALIMDNADINIKLATDAPASSAITGSRPNSMLRYRTEQWNGSLDSVAAYILENPHNTECASLLLAATKDPANAAIIKMLIDSLQTPATTTQCYSYLQNWVKRQLALSEGNIMPNFSFTTTHGTTAELDSLRNHDQYTAIVFSASWCSPCSTAVGQMKTVEPPPTVVEVNIDAQAGGWNSALVHDLAIEHIPFIILLAPDGTIAARDIRWWEMERTMKRHSQ